ncbi:hypothetical protein [Allosphingosinicella deserti]|uniref:hypothetical protein n=1 Tax=Allosphingosinicella deserti TaxID=2116704 RepID=UPI001E3814FC|nr:hypothetical protein [Sphingomonas deserti]
MSTGRVAAVALMASALALSACGEGQAPAAQNDAAVVAPAAAGVTRQEVVPPEAPVAPMPAQTVIQSQPGPDGSQVDLLKVAVTGDILTVTMRCSSEQRINTESFGLEGISVIDDATAQRIGVLKDNEGKWLASNASGNSIQVGCEAKPGILWAKFPAPPATSKTVSINLPETAPFDGVPVTR